MEFSNFGKSQTGFSPAFLPQQNIMTGENYCYVRFLTTNGNRVILTILADSSIENMIQILINKSSIKPEDNSFIYNNKKRDINSQLIIKE